MSHRQIKVLLQISVQIEYLCLEAFYCIFSFAASWNYFAIVVSQRKNRGCIQKGVPSCYLIDVPMKQKNAVRFANIFFFKKLLELDSGICLKSQKTVIFFSMCWQKFYLLQIPRGRNTLTTNTIFYHENQIGRNADYNSYQGVHFNKHTHTCLGVRKSRPPLSKTEKWSLFFLLSTEWNHPRWQSP